MSVFVMGAVWDLRLATARKIVLLKMADHADRDGRNAYPSVGRVARDTGLSARSVQRILAGFVADGALEVEAEGGGRGKATMYRIDVARARSLYGSAAPCGADSAGADEAEKGDTVSGFCRAEEAGKGDTVSGFAGPGKGDTGAGKGDTGDAKGCQSLSPQPSGTVKEPSEAPPVGPPPLPASSPDAAAPPGTAERGGGVLPAGGTPAEAVAAYNRVAEACGLPLCRYPSPDRRRRLAARLRELGGLAGWEALLARVAASAHLRGDNRDGFRANLDFLSRPKNVIAVMEGHYDDRNRERPGAGAGRGAGGSNRGGGPGRPAQGAASAAIAGIARALGRERPG